MKKIVYGVFCASILVGATACQEFLETSSPSVVDENFVFSDISTARKALDGAYEAWRQVGSNHAFGDGLYYAADVTGSDIERHPEGYTAQPARHRPEGLYENGAAAGIYTLNSYEDDNKSYSLYLRAYKAIGQATAVVTAIEESGQADEFVAEQPTELSQLYAEAVTMRACCYRELIRYYGDVPFGEAEGLVSRHAIYDNILADLIKVEPLMFRVGEGGVGKDSFSRTFVQGLIGRIALDAAGYQTHRSDIEYVDADENPISFENLGQANAAAGNAFYARRSNYMEFYQIAKTYFKKVIDNPGSAQFHESDPRAADAGGKRVYDNPYQYFFAQMHQDSGATEHYADESIYEITQTYGNGNTSRPYSFGRPSTGGGTRTATDGYPCKNYGQGRINAAYYYGIFDPNDKRRDVSIAVTGSNNGTEKLLPVAPGSQANGGGMALNKWDENRQEVPNPKQRISGINAPYMRMAEIYLGYAEACAVTGDTGEATTYLKKIRERSFPSGQANTEAFIASCEDLLDAVVEERGFEFAGEGDRRWTLIRTGKIGPKIRRIKELTAAMINGLQASGSYTFANGNVISDYVYTKKVDGKKVYGYNLTAEPQDKNDPVLYPGWRGQHDDWAAVGEKAGFTITWTTYNLAIRNLFKVEKPASYKIVYTWSDEEAAKKAGAKVGDVAKAENPKGTTVAAIRTEASDLQKKDENKPYAVTAYALFDGDSEYWSIEDWGTAYVQYKSEYLDNLFTNYDYVSAPVYLWPFTINTLLTGGFTNGYGFLQE